MISVYDKFIALCINLGEEVKKKLEFYHPEGVPPGESPYLAWVKPWVQFSTPNI